MKFPSCRRWPIWLVVAVLIVMAGWISTTHQPQAGSASVVTRPWLADDWSPYNECRYRLWQLGLKQVDYDRYCIFRALTELLLDTIVVADNCPPADFSSIQGEGAINFEPGVISCPLVQSPVD